jgi:hypothetical protein
MEVILIVVLSPVFSQDSYLFEVFEKVGIKYIFSELAVKPLDVGILCGFAGLNILDFHFSFAEVLKGFCDKFGTIIYPDMFGQATFFF